MRSFDNPKPSRGLSICQQRKWERQLDQRTAKPDPDETYEPIMSFSGPAGTFSTGTRLAGSHPAVRASFGSFMLATLPDDAKHKLRTSAMFGNQPVATHAAHEAPPSAQPPSGRFRALGTWTLTDPDLQHRARINAGDLIDASDEVFKRYPHLFTAAVEDR